MLYPSYFKLHVRWLHSVTRITYLSKLIGTPSLAAFLKLEFFRVYRPSGRRLTRSATISPAHRKNPEFLPRIRDSY
ncbi:hypothetical protein BV924_13485 [Pectobacterium odoriferum]|uniref:Uncharacterized protein n=1 Tax=Pectobacterium odoriferum TaxID=78398 RepID=A0ABD6VPU4_9GAMM|nr:hypothetical protein BVY06_14935 [Pectobacterium odoriferum]POE06808.1 hypothetical protein BV916_02780 [Pectobacterium odoriferum]POE12161.1 hypothetical protein BV924_13485 [Pectobacterium odoriferum]POE18384.1 hypothetical protein BV918_10380 [Pectobacterium odoriferum]POE19080.1 hypothetical protein BV923_20240 [Pectobacterium odoriferum]